MSNHYSVGGHPAEFFVILKKEMIRDVEDVPMVNAIGYGLLSGIGQLFLNPLFYGIVLIAWWFSLKRIKNERSHFQIRVYPAIPSFLASIYPGIVVGLILSVVLLIVGFVLPVGTIYFMSLLSVVLGLARRGNLLSPYVLIGVTALLAVMIPQPDPTTNWFSARIAELATTPVSHLLALLAILSIAESVFIFKQAQRFISPRLLKGKRGKWIGAYDMNHVWFLPLFFVVPGAMVERFQWWPLLSSEASFSFMLAPLAIGFHQLVQHYLPRHVIRANGQHVLWNGLLSLAVAAVAIWQSLDWVAWAGLVFAIAWRAGYAFYFQRKDRVAPATFVPRYDGIPVLGMLPGSPADKMNLQIGERIQKVNGMNVTNAYDFYQAIQQNAAHCKLEVIDTRGEIRFEQRSLYEHEHHQLGLLFISEHEAADRAN